MGTVDWDVLERIVEPPASTALDKTDITLILVDKAGNVPRGKFYTFPKPEMEIKLRIDPSLIDLLRIELPNSFVSRWPYGWRW